MFYELAQFFKIFLVSPITWMVATLIAGFTVRGRRWRTALLALSGMLFLLFTDPVLFQLARRAAARHYIQADIRPGKVYDTVVVLGGFGNISDDTRAVEYTNRTADRLWEAVRLWREGRVKRIMIAGDGTVSPRPDGFDPEPDFLAYMERQGVPREVFVNEKRALNTRQNAEYSIAMLDSMGVADSDCLLLTSATHMERAINCFARLGYHPDYYPVTIPDPVGPITHRSFYPRWEVAVEWEELFNELIGSVIYRISGYN